MAKHNCDLFTAVYIHTILLILSHKFFLPLFVLSELVVAVGTEFEADRSPFRYVMIMIVVL